MQGELTHQLSGAGIGVPARELALLTDRLRIIDGPNGFKDLWYEYGWRSPRFACSRKGGHTVIALDEDHDPEPPNYNKDFAQLRLGVVDNQKMKVRWVATLRRERTLNVVASMAISDDGRYIAVNGWGNGASLVDAQAGKALWEMRPQRELRTQASTFAPDGEVLYMGGEEGCLYVLKVRTGDVLHEWSPLPADGKESAQPIKCLAASADGRLVAAGLAGGTVCIMDAKTGQHLLYLNREQALDGMSFSPDSMRLVTNGGGEFRVWEMPAVPAAPQEEKP